MFDREYRFVDIEGVDSIARAELDQLLSLPIESLLDRQSEEREMDLTHAAVLASSGYFELNDGTVDPTDKVIACRLLAHRYVRETVAPNWQDAERLNTTISEIRSFGIRHDGFGSLLSDVFCIAHKDHGLDVVNKTIEECESERNASHFWDGLSSSLAFLKVDCATLLRLLRLIYRSYESGSFGYDIFGAVQKVAEHQPELGKELLEVLPTLANDPLQTLLSNVMLGLAEIDFAEMRNVSLEWIKSDDPILIAAGIYSACSFEYNDDRQWNEAYELFKTLEDSHDEAVVTALVTAYGHDVATNPYSQSAIHTFSTSKSPRVQSRIANVLSRNSREHGKEKWLQSSLAALGRATNEDSGFWDSLDHTLQSLVETNRDYVTDFIETWLQTHDYAVHDLRTSITELFRSTFVKLGSENLHTFECLVTKWFSSDETKLHRAASDIVGKLSSSRLNDEPFKFELASELAKDMQYVDFVFLIRKILGY